ncbi:MAG: hypothetical protein IJ168_10645, partial [Eubacterium sp.]|nr:hypothetical protein [Eubacterium sp.]
EEMKDSKNPYYEAQPSNKVLGTRTKFAILQAGEVLIPLPRGKRARFGALFFLREEMKDSKNPYYEAQPSNKVLGTRTKFAILQAGEVLIPLPPSNDHFDTSGRFALLFGYITAF